MIFSSSSPLSVKLSMPIGRARNSSPSEGSLAWHQLNQKTLAALAFDLNADALPPSVVWSKPARSYAAAKP